MIDHDNAYGGLVEARDDARWAFGTGFDDPLAGVDTTLPPGADGGALAVYCLMLADDALVASQRLAQWSTHAPELEEEVALANIGLDLLGQARLLLARAAAADASVVPALPAGSPVPPEDALAFFRGASEFRNVVLCEIANGDFADAVARLLIFSTWRLALLQRLRSSADPVLAAVAAKGANEVTYHRDYAARWVVTLAGGTDLSRRRIAAAIPRVWPYVAELFTGHPTERSLVATGVGVDTAELRPEFDKVIGTVLHAAGLPVPDIADAVGMTGRDGAHSAALDAMLAEMQDVARTHPMGRW